MKRSRILLIFSLPLLTGCASALAIFLGGYYGVCKFNENSYKKDRIEMVYDASTDVVRGVVDQLANDSVNYKLEREDSLPTGHYTYYLQDPAGRVGVALLPLDGPRTQVVLFLYKFDRCLLDPQEDFGGNQQTRMDFHNRLTESLRQKGISKIVS